MADEVRNIILTNSTGFPKMYTCASGTAIAKGTPLVLSTPYTVAAPAASSWALYAGVAAMDKAADDGATQISVYTDFDGTFVASGAITVGEEVVLAGAGSNRVQAARVGKYVASGAQIVGVALQTAVHTAPVAIRSRV